MREGRGGGNREREIEESMAEKRRGRCRRKFVLYIYSYRDIREKERERERERQRKMDGIRRHFNHVGAFSLTSAKLQGRGHIAAASAAWVRGSFGHVGSRLFQPYGLAVVSSEWACVFQRCFSNCCCQCCFGQIAVPTAWGCICCCSCENMRPPLPELFGSFIW